MAAFQAHPSAIVDEGAVVGDGTRIWHWVHVCSGARIGPDCSLGQGVFVSGGALIGKGVKIQNHVSIYDGVELADEVFCGPSVVFTNVLNPRSAVNRKAEFRTTRVGRGASLGANCTVVCGVTLGAYCLVGAGAVVTGDVADYAVVMGVPARQTGWASAHGLPLDLPLSLPPGQRAHAQCPETGQRYVLTGDKLMVEVSE